MKTYVGTKRIEAEPMTRGDYLNSKGIDNATASTDTTEGYLVKYSDGYESWSPKEQFENAYKEVGSDTLNDTVLLMQSANTKERFMAEYYQTLFRFMSLRDMLDKWDKGTLDFVPSCPRGILGMQVKAMSEYLVILETRAVIEGISLK